MSSVAGISFATLSTSANGMSSARATSRTAALAFIVPNVMICGDVLAAVLARDVLDDLAAAALAEVDVDIGQRHALGVEEALEDEVVLQRIDVGDPQAVRHEAARGRSTARADRNPLLPRVSDEVPDDQEIARVLHPLDHLDLVRETRLVVLDGMPERSGRGERRRRVEPLGEAVPHLTCSK